MEKFEIRPASRVHATQLAPRLRPGDLMELHRATGEDPLEALLDSVRVSDEDMCWTALYQGHPVAMFGCNELYPDQPGVAGGIWMLCSAGIYHNKIDFMRCCKKYLAVMHTRYEYLTNFIDEDNIPSQTWLPRLGFKPVLRVPDFGHAQTPFIQYISQKE